MLPERKREKQREKERLCTGGKAERERELLITSAETVGLDGVGKITE